MKPQRLFNFLKENKNLISGINENLLIYLDLFHCFETFH